MPSRSRVFWTFTILGPIIGTLAMVGVLNLLFPPQVAAQPELRAAALVAAAYFIFGFAIGGLPAAMTGTVIAWLRLEPRVATLPLAALIGAIATIVFLLLSYFTARYAPRSFDWETFKNLLLFTAIGAFAVAVCWLTLIGHTWKTQRATLGQPVARSDD